MSLQAPQEVTHEGWVTMFHATTRDCAATILADRFRPGTYGLLGGAMYFSKSEFEAVKRSRTNRHGADIVVLEAEVFLGRCGHYNKYEVQVTGKGLDENGLNSAKVVNEDSYCVAESNSYRLAPWRKIRNVKPLVFVEGQYQYDYSWDDGASDGQPDEDNYVADSGVDEEDGEEDSWGGYEPSPKRQRCW